jgi:hypothetical protein
METAPLCYNKIIVHILGGASMKTKQIELDDINVELKVLKYGKFKKVVSKFSGLVLGLFALLDVEDDSKLADGIVGYIGDNIGQVEQVMYELTDLTTETIEEIYITDFIVIFEELLNLYGIDKEVIVGFFKNNIRQNQAI